LATLQTLFDLAVPCASGTADQTELEWSEVRSKLKFVAATAGASAVVAMGALTATLSDDSSSTTIVSGPEVSLGETTTIEKAASTPETTMAVPEHTAEPPEGFR
jgi:hypothetical protein